MVSGLTLASHIAAVSTLVLLMLGVGCSLPRPLSRLRKGVSRAVLARLLVLNFLFVPAVAVLLARASPSAGVMQALVLLGCLPAGPVSLLFVSQRRRALVLRTTWVVVLQVAGVLLSPVLLLLSGFLAWGSALSASPRQAVAALFVQMFLLELVPMALGWALVSQRPEYAATLRRGFRRASSVSLGLAALGFALLYKDSLAHVSWLGAGALFALFVVACWMLTWLSVSRRHLLDQGQITMLRNVSLALVIAATTPGFQDAVIYVLLGAVMTTVPAPVLRLLRRPRGRAWAPAPT